MPPQGSASTARLFHARRRNTAWGSRDSRSAMAAPASSASSARRTPAQPQTCDLLGKACVDVAPGSVSNCRTCSNDLQCASGHRCIPMDFEGTSHGHYCLVETPPTCSRPFAVTLCKPSISGAAAANYCAIDEDLTTCDAVIAHLQAWTCSGTDGICSPDGIMPEQSVPGAICAPIGSLGDGCTARATQHCSVPTVLPRIPAAMETSCCLLLWGLSGTLPDCRNGQHRSTELACLCMRFNTAAPRHERQTPRAVESDVEHAMPPALSRR